LRLGVGLTGVWAFTKRGSIGHGYSAIQEPVDKNLRRINSRPRWTIDNVGRLCQVAQSKSRKPIFDAVDFLKLGQGWVPSALFTSLPSTTHVHACRDLLSIEKDANIKYSNSSFISIPSDSYRIFSTKSLSFVIAFHVPFAFHSPLLPSF